MSGRAASRSCLVAQHDAVGHPLADQRPHARVAAASPRRGWRTGRSRRAPGARSRPASRREQQRRDDDEGGGEGPAGVWSHGGASLRARSADLAALDPPQPDEQRQPPSTAPASSRRAPTRWRPSGARSSAPARTSGPASARRRRAPPARPAIAQASGSANWQTMAGAEASSAAPSATPEIMPVPSETTCWPSRPTGSAHVCSIPGAAIAVPIDRDHDAQGQRDERQDDARQQLGGEHARAPGHQGEGGQRPFAATTPRSRAGCPTIGSRMLAGATAIASIERSVWSSGGPNRHAATTTTTVSSDDRELQPEAGAGVGHLAQLDGGQPGEAGRAWERDRTGAGWARAAALMRPPWRSARSTGPRGPPPRRAPGG